MWTISELKEQGKAALKENYWTAVGAGFVMTLLTGGAGGSFARGGGRVSDAIEKSGEGGFENLSELFHSDKEALIAVFAIMGILLTFIIIASVISTVITVFIKNPVLVGYAAFNIKGLEDKAKFELLGSGFKGKYLRNVGGIFLMGLIVSLLSLLCIIPGVYAAYCLRLVPYILADRPELSVKEALSLSNELMNGNKLNSFLLDLSFIGWNILSALTCGILGIFYVKPYVEFTNAALYRAVSSEKQEV